MWGLPFLERVTEWRECAADGKRLPLRRQRSPVYEGRGPGKRMPPGPPQGTSVLHTLGKYFPECYKRCLGVGSLFCCDGGISSYALELVPFIGGEFQLPAWCQVC